MLKPRTPQRRLPALLLILAMLAAPLFASGCGPGAPGANPPTAGETPPDRFDLIIRGGTVVDGTGAPGFIADVGIIGQRIAAVGDLAGKAAGETIDATGMIVAPGFINAHSHTDENYLATRGAESALMQGITTEIGGQDGRSPLDLDQFFADMAKGGSGVNQALLIGHGALRKAVMGTSPGKPSDAQLKAMQDLLRAGLEAGAVGLSAGLEYTPGKYADAAELSQLAAVLVPYGGIYAPHMRNEGTGLLDAVNETLTIGRESGAKVEIAHIKAVGERAAGLSQAAVAAIEAARANGQAVLADVYPYQTPDYAQNLRLADVYRCYTADRLVVKVAQDRSLLERSLADIAAGLGLAPAEAAAQLTAADPAIMVYALLETDDDLEAFLSADFTVFSNDAGAKPRYSAASAYLVHPRTYGAFPRIFGRYVRERQLLSLEMAVHKATAKVADYFGLVGRGRIAKGYYADLVVFSSTEIADRATFASPQEYPVGISHVLVNGTPAVRDGKPTGARAGMAVRRGQ
ncbi:MAG: N-acyl-D-amino-acid deacylase family protein [Chloroflexota bacterium]